MSRFARFLCLLLVFALAACESDSAETQTPQQPAATVDAAPVVLPTQVDIPTEETSAVGAPEAYPIAAAAVAEVEAVEAYPADAVVEAELPTPLPAATEVATLTMDVAAVASQTVTESAPAVDDDFQPPVVPQPEQPTVVSSELAGLVFKNALGVWRVAAKGDVVLLTAPVEGADWDSTPVALSPQGTHLALVVDGDLHRFDLTNRAIERIVESSAESECCYIEWINATGVLFGTYLSEEEFGPNIGHVTYFDSATFSYELLGATVSFGLPAVAPSGQLAAIDQLGAPSIISLPGGTPVEIALAPIAKAWSAGWEPSGNRIAWLGTPASDPTQIGLAIVDVDAGSVEFVSSYPPIATEWLPSQPAWQPSGEWIAYEAIPLQASDAGIWLINAADQTERFVGPGTNPQWHVDGSALVFETINGIELRVIETGENIPTLLKGNIVGWLAP